MRTPISPSIMATISQASTLGIFRVSRVITWVNHCVNRYGITVTANKIGWSFTGPLIYPLFRSVIVWCHRQPHPYKEKEHDVANREFMSAEYRDLSQHLLSQYHDDMGANINRYSRDGLPTCDTEINERLEILLGRTMKKQ